MDSIELSRLAECESVIERGMKTFVEVGAALVEIRDSRLYRQTFGTFEDYCRDRWGMSRPKAYQLMDAATVTNNLSTIVDILPTKESQVRPLTRLEPEVQREVWARVIDSTPREKITAAVVLEAARAIQNEKREVKRAEVVKRLESIEAQEVKAAAGVFDVIVIDPPWPMEKIERDVAPNQVAFEYPTMTLAEIGELNIPCADDCHVWLWTTHKFLPAAFALLEQWGMKYVCAFVWHKPGGFQPWGLPQYNSEFALYARRGTPSFIDFKDFKNCFNAPRGAHSEKPQEFYDLVNRVTSGRRLDMFNRRKIEGFTGWGNEAE